MSDWPDLLDITAFGVLGTAAEGSQYGDVGMNLASTFNATGAWPSANASYFYPVLVRKQITVYQLGWLNGATLSGNADVGIYNAARQKVISTGSTTQAGTSAIQLVDIADTVLAPGLYYLAMGADNTTATYQRVSLGAALARTCGVAQQAAAFPLPASATFAAMAQAQMPLIVGAIAGATF